MALEFKHFAHDCMLTFHDLCEDGNENINCYLCSEVICGPAYICESCHGSFQWFNLHESCAKLPSQIIAHSLHPHHPLTFVIVHSYFREPFICNGCDDYSYGVCRFSCEECVFNLDIKCASSMDHQSLQEMDRKTNIDHFTHEHTLVPCNYKKGRQDACYHCNEIIEGPIYVCMSCEFFIHESCTKFPPEITHPLHTHHPLTIVRDKKGFICDGCRYVSYGPRYNCQECGYNLDFKCGSSIDDCFSMCNRETLEEMDKKGNVNHFCHKHTLTLSNLREGHIFYCNYCSGIIHRSAYVCLDCSVYFHDLCTKLPTEITHPLHPHHPLTLILKNPEFTCDGCKNVYSSVSKFYCNLCPFNLDVKCASLMDDFFPQTLQKTVRKININHFSHKHTLRLCNSSNIYKVDCCFCYKTINGSAYVCRSCEFYIHESCKDQMPEYVEHPFHTKHDLHHEHIAKDDHSKKCSACKSSISHINLSCWHSQCHIDLHPACAKPLARPLKLKLKFHQCHLFYIGHDESSKKFRCRICKGKSLHASVYRCVDCKVNIHVECIPIPPIVEIQCHEHPLTLLDSVKDYHFNGEYYCDICEEKGNSKHHLYYCEECIYIAHIECVITEDYTLIADETEEDTEKNDEVQGKDAKDCSFEQGVHTLIKEDTSLEKLSYLEEQLNNVEDGIDELKEVDTEKEQKTHAENYSLEQARKEEEGESSLVCYHFLDQLNEEMGDLCLNFEYLDDQEEDGESSLVRYQFLPEENFHNIASMDEDLEDSKGESSMFHHQSLGQEDGQDIKLESKCCKIEVNLSLRLGY